MRILVTGGAGYVGSHVVRALQEAGHEPVVYDNLSTGHARSVAGVELISGDIGDPAKLQSVLRRERFDGCIHLAAASLVGESVRNPSRYFRNNVVAGIELFDSLVSCEVPWLVLSSTAGVYGEPKAVPITEDHPQVPLSPYGESKLMLERILGWYEKAYGFRHVALRYFNAAGAHHDGDIGEDHTPETHLIPIVLKAALGQSEGVSVFGTDYPTPDGTAVRDYVHVCDLASAHLAAIAHLNAGKPSNVYNLGLQRGYSVLEVIETARNVTGRTIPVTYGDRRSGDPAVLVASSEVAESTLAWEPKLGLVDMVESAWRWHVAHPHGYQD
jgi:UDP-glucose 4-epimerase